MRRFHEETHIRATRQRVWRRENEANTSYWKTIERQLEFGVNAPPWHTVEGLTRKYRAIIRSLKRRGKLNYRKARPQRSYSCPYGRPQPGVNENKRKWREMELAQQ